MYELTKSSDCKDSFTNFAFLRLFTVTQYFLNASSLKCMSLVAKVFKAVTHFKNRYRLL